LDLKKFGLSVYRQPTSPQVLLQRHEAVRVLVVFSHDALQLDLVHVLVVVRVVECRVLVLRQHAIPVQVRSLELPLLLVNTLQTGSTLMTIKALW